MKTDGLAGIFSVLNIVINKDPVSFPYFTSQFFTIYFLFSTQPHYSTSFQWDSEDPLKLIPGYLSTLSAGGFASYISLSCAQRPKTGQPGPIYMVTSAVLARF